LEQASDMIFIPVQGTQTSVVAVSVPGDLPDDPEDVLEILQAEQVPTAAVLRPATGVRVREHRRASLQSTERGVGLPGRCGGMHGRVSWQGV